MTGRLTENRFRVAGLLVLCICSTTVNAQDTSCAEPVGRWGYGPSRTVATTADDLVLVGSGTVLRIVTFGYFGDPTIIADLDLGGLINDIAIDDTYALVATENLGLRVIDIQTPGAPVEIGHTELPQSPLSIALEGDFIYIATAYQGLQILYNPVPVLSPYIVGSFDTPGRAVDVTVINEIAFVADESGGMRVIDVSDPASPNELSYFPISYLTYSVAVAGDLAYVVQRDSPFTKLRIVDVGNPAAPIEVGWVSVGTGGTGGWSFVEGGV